MSEADTIKAIRQAARRRQRAIEQRREAAEELHDLLLVAKGERISIARIARETGLSRQGLYELRDQPPS